MEDMVRNFLRWMGENPDREGLINTPKRVVKMYEELLSGYGMNLSDIVNDAIFYEETIKDMIVLRDIDFFSLCEHHILPIIGKAHIAYIPDGKVIGLSKIPRVVDVFARRLQIQEQMTEQIAESLMKIS